MTRKHLLILGGGTAGAMISNKLVRKLAASEWQITVVAKDDVHDYKPSYLFIPFGMNKAESVRKSGKSFLRAGINKVTGTVERVDAPTKTVHLEGGTTLQYDYLVIATGAHPRPDQTPGTLGPQFHKEVGEFYSLEGAKAVKRQLDNWRGGKLVVHITDFPIMCPVAPLEFVLLADAMLRKRGLRAQTELIYVTPLDGAFTKPVASKLLGDLLEKRQINVVTDFAIERIDQDAKAIVSYDEREVAYDQLVTIPLNMGADFVGASGLGDDLNFVEIDKHKFNHAKYPEIFAMGDAGNLPTSKAGSVAHFAVDIFVENFLQLAAGKPMTHSFDGHTNCFVESGNGKALLLDFNYETQPLPGKFPFPGVGPLTLLGESRLNHWSKLAFRWIYWNMLVPGRPIPLKSAMSMTGKDTSYLKAAPAAAASSAIPSTTTATPTTAPTAAAEPAAPPTPDFDGPVPTF